MLICFRSPFAGVDLAKLLVAKVDRVKMQEIIAKLSATLVNCAVKEEPSPVEAFSTVPNGNKATFQQPSRWS